MKYETYFIGYDAREHEAAAVTAYSIARRATNRYRIYVLEHRTLRRLGLFKRPWNILPDGQFIDQRDMRPFSTEFSHSRFLVFHLARELKCTGPCMFVDCDWLFLSDPSKLMTEQKARPDKIGVVKRDRTVEENSTKMDGMVQQNYNRKLWSALFTFMPSDKWATIMDPGTVNHATGRELHSFANAPEDDFWSINPEWHYIPSLDDPPEMPKGIHYSEFSPWINPERVADFSTSFDLWYSERARYLNHAARVEITDPWRKLEADLLAAKA